MNNNAITDPKPEQAEHVLWQGKPQRPLSAASLPGLYVTATLIAALLVWSFTGPVPALMAEMYANVFENTMVRGILFITAVSCLVIPHFYVRQINNSRYLVTDRRAVVQTCGTQATYDYSDISFPKVKPLGEGLANLSFWKRDAHGRQMVILHAIPAAVAEDAAKHIARAE